MLKTAIMLLLVAITVSIPLQSSPINTRNTIHEVLQKTLLNKTIILYNSYYPVKKVLLEMNTPIYYTSQIQNYTVTNIDNDNYPDIVIWTLKGVYIWSWNKGIYAKIKPTYMFDDPILIDNDKDGVIDYIILIDHPFYDAKYYVYTHRKDVKTIVKIWYPLNNTVKLIGSVNSILISKTHLLLKNKLYLPGIVNLYFSYKDISYTELGVAIIDLKTETIKYLTFYRERFKAEGYIVINDITTNYESYIYKINDHEILYVPMGLDKVFLLGINGSIKLLETINLQNPNTPYDSMILIPRKMPPHSPETRVVQYTSITTNYYFYEIQLSDIYIDNESVIIPYGRTIVRPPVYPINGYYPYVKDYSRFEKAIGILTIDLKNKNVEKQAFIGQTIDGYTLRAITSIRIINRTHILVGAIAENKKTNNYELKCRSIVVVYKYINNQWVPSIIYSVPINYNNARYLPILAGKDYIVTASYYYINNTIVKYHRETYDQHVPLTKYYWNPPILRPLYYLDLDNDGFNEYFTIVQYQRNSYSSWSYSYVAVGHNPPYIYAGKAWLLLFKHPVVRIIARGEASLGSNVTLEVTMINTPISSAKIFLINNNTIKELGMIEGSGRAVYNILLEKTGKYIIQINTTTTYYANETLLTNKQGEKVEYNETVNITLFYLKYKTRITIIEPSSEYLTPNTYTPNLTVKALLEIQDYNGSWKPITLLENLSLTAWNNNVVINNTMKATNTPGIYSGEIHGLKPGALLLLVSFSGDEYYEASRNTTIIQLLKYPVTISIEAINETYALTPINITIKAYYYKLDGDKWIRTRLNKGDIYLEVEKEQTMETQLVKPWNTTLIDKYIVLPPSITIKAEYNPPNIYYTEASSTFSIKVLKLKIIHISNTTVPEGEPLKTILYEEAGEKPRPLTAPYNILLMNKTYIWKINSNSPSLTIETSRLRPGNYTIYLNITRYREAYINPETSWNISILPLETNLELMIDPVVKIRGSNYYTYTLTPVIIKTLMNNTNAELNNILITIDNKYTISVKPGEAVTVKFRDPGVHNIYAYTYYYGTRIDAVSRVTVYPQPVRISIEYYGSGELAVYTSTILGDPAPGNITVKIYSDKQEYTMEKTSNGKASIILAGYPSGIYMVEVIYRGNRSYLEASNTTTIYITNKTPPLPEPISIPIVLLVAVISILIKNMDKRRRGVLR